MGNETPHISTYPVGLLWDIRRRRVRSGLSYIRGRIADRNWRAVRNYFNGYLAEWHYCPDGVNHYRCGRGWTRKAALRRLGRHIIEANTPELAA
jgi:hypothetical protein